VARLALGAALLGACLSGCAAEDKFEEEPVKAQLRQICKAYFMHMDFHRRPPNEQQLRAAAEDLHKLQMGVPAEEAFVSPRDQQPLVIIYGADTNDPSGSILAYEQLGSDDGRWVLFMNADIKLLSKDEFSRATFAHNHQPAGA
jgi:hypothetical protein